MRSEEIFELKLIIRKINFFGLLSGINVLESIFIELESAAEIIAKDGSITGT